MMVKRAEMIKRSLSNIHKRDSKNSLARGFTTVNKSKLHKTLGKDGSKPDRTLTNKVFKLQVDESEIKQPTFRIDERDESSDLDQDRETDSARLKKH